MYKGGLYLALGDSITASNTASNAGVNDNYVRHIAQLIKSNYRSIQLINKGISGSKSQNIVNNFYYNMRFQPNLVTICIGTNDFSNGVSVNSFTNNLNAIVSKIKSRNPNAVIILCAPPNRNDTDQTNLANFRTAIQSVAKSYNTAFCDFSTAWNPANTTTYTVDGLHPNVAGHQLIANILWPVVKSAASNWLNSLKN